MMTDHEVMARQARKILEMESQILEMESQIEKLTKQYNGQLTIANDFYKELEELGWVLGYKGYRANLVSIVTEKIKKERFK